MSPSTERAAPIRIGELSRRVGVSAELLRAWERRYDLLTPMRTSGGLRLYGKKDERCVARMLEHLTAGVSAAEAARLTRREFQDEGPPVGGTPLRDDVPGADGVGGPLREALDRLDESGAHAVLDRLLASFTLETVVLEAVLPYLHELGERWESDGDSMIGQEHFASALLRGRLLGLARGWGSGYGPMALLACLPGDQHDLGLICFGLALRTNGWRITFLGPDTPLATVAETAILLRPAIVVLSATIPPDQAAVGDNLTAITAVAPLALAGAGATESTAVAAGARLLPEDPFVAAQAIAAATPPA